MPPIFKTPQYSKSINPKTGIHEPCYTFNIEFSETDDLLIFIANNNSEISLQSLQKCVQENFSWWNSLIKNFLDISSKLFSKPYTVENINKIAKHTLSEINKSNSDNNKFPVNVILIPKNIQISGGVFTVNWGYKTEQMIIDIPDQTESENINNEVNNLPVSKINLNEDIEELNMDELPIENAITADELEIDSPNKIYQKQRVKEARLKAKLALYKAQRQMAKYYETYGDDISDSDSDSNSEYHSSDDESENGSEEEVQL
jgi:hypothetical protein